MSIETAQRELIGYHRELARLQEEKGREVQRAAEAAKKAATAVDSAARTSSASLRQSKFREAQRCQGDANTHQRKAADLETKIATVTKRSLDVQKRLADAQKKAAADQARTAKQQLDDQKKAAQDHERRMRAITGTLAAHSRLHVETKTMVDKLQQIPERITVLFLALEPRDQPKLRLGEEARAIQEMIRKSKHRDSIAFESEWAVRPMDVLQHINQYQPHIVHFSGHGSKQDELIFQDDAGRTKKVTKEALVQTMAATSSNIQIVFFNSCHSRDQAEAVVKYVNAAIGMNSSIGDDAARIFAAQFYSAIGFGLSVHNAFQQAKAALMLEGIAEEDTPELLVGADIDSEQLVLVRPDAGPVPNVTGRLHARIQPKLVLVQSEARRMKEHGEHLNAGLHNGFWQQYIRLKFKPERVEAVYVDVFDAIRYRPVLVTSLNDLIAAATAADQAADRFLAGDANAVHELQQQVLNATNHAHHVERGINTVVEESS